MMDQQCNLFQSSYKKTVYKIVFGDYTLVSFALQYCAVIAHALVEQFCKEWVVTYHQTDLVGGIIEALKHLSNVANEFGELYAHEFVGEFSDDRPTM